MRKHHKTLQIVVRTLSSSSTRGWLQYGPLVFPCALGLSGKTADKREGDKATPIGTWHLLNLLYRADRMVRPHSALPTRAIHQDDGWCDTARDRNYNRPVTHPYAASAERLWRDDNLYDLLLTLDHNTLPRSKGRGSAIFIHITRPGYQPSEGCITLKQQHLKQLIAHLSPRTRIKI